MEDARPATEARPSLEEDRAIKLPLGAEPWLEEKISGPEADKERLMLDWDPGATERLGIELMSKVCTYIKLDINNDFQ